MHSPSDRAVTALTQGPDVPSTRFRWQQFVPALEAHGLRCRTENSGVGAYPPAGTLARIRWGAHALADAHARVRRANAQSDLVFVQRQLLATLCTFEPWIKRPMVLDVDDAIFLGSRGAQADRIADRAALVICGNSFLAEHFGARRPVAILPTAVDTERFTPIDRPAAVPTLGWSGSASGYPYLVEIQPALLVLMTRYPELRLRIVSNAPPPLPLLPAHRVDYIPWRPEIEVSALQDLTVGLMPLADSPWERGKCSFKMLTYMACGVPVAVSPVGMNVEVLAQADVGLAAATQDDWVDAISALIDAPSLAREKGARGRQTVCEHYALDVVGERLVGLLKAQLR